MNLAEKITDDQIRQHAIENNLEYWKLKGIIIAMEDMGAIYRDINYKFIYFDIPKGCEIDDDKKLSRASQGCSLLDRKLKIKRV